MHITLIRSGIFLLACVSPLLTTAWLWQIKEWRLDRLKEHLRSEGYTRQLIGKLRPSIFLIVWLALTQTHLPAYAKIDALIASFALLALVQILTLRQRYPTWTAKAALLVFASLVINGLLIGLLPNSNWLLALLPMTQWLVLLVTWTLFLPLDISLKHRIMKQARLLRERYEKLTVIGITGSVGKTTTKELLAHILSDQNVLFTPAYVNSEMGVSQWLLRELPKKNKDEALTMIVEMGAYRPGEIQRLCDIARPSIGIITYIGTQHIALFGSQEKLCQAKAELITSLPSTGHAILNGDNEFCDQLKTRTRAAITVVGTGGHADLKAYDIEETGNGIRFRVGDEPFSIPLHGTHNTTNVLLAITAGRILGLGDRVIAKKLQTFTPPSHTFTIRTENGITVLDDTHNASPESFRAAIAWAASQPMKHKILVTPGLIELGAQEQRIHSELGAQARGIFSRVLFTSIKHKTLFHEGYKDPIELATASSAPLQKDGLLVCVGRVPPSVIRALTK